MAELIEVTYAINGTTKTDLFRCDHASVQAWPGGLADVVLDGGSDEHGPVRDVLYTEAYRIVRRPESTEGKPR